MSKKGVKKPSTKDDEYDEKGIFVEEGTPRTAENVMNAVWVGDVGSEYDSEKEAKLQQEWQEQCKLAREDSCKPATRTPAPVVVVPDEA